MSTKTFPFFSICIPNYNYGRYIGLTIQSVLDQSWPHFEIIVSDNASTDDSVSVVKSFSDPRIRLLQNPVNLGFASNLDHASETARGDYMMMLSSDDLMKPGALEIYAGLLHHYDAGDRQIVLSSGIEIIDGEGAVKGTKPAMVAELKNTMREIGLKPVSVLEDLEIY